MEEKTNALPFTLDEYQQRLANVKQSMSEQGIDVLFLVEPANMNYVSGYDAMSYYVPQGVVVSLEEDMPTWIGRFQDQYSAVITTWLDDAHIRLIQTNIFGSQKNFMSWILLGTF